VNEGIEDCIGIGIGIVNKYSDNDSEQAWHY
jgi:hypothetical protein